MAFLAVEELKPDQNFYPCISTLVICIIRLLFFTQKEKPAFWGRSFKIKSNCLFRVNCANWKR